MFKKSRIKEEHVLGILREKGYSAELLEMFDSRGNALPQTYRVNGYFKSHPDIDVYESGDKKEVILRVEIKGFINLPEINNQSFLGIECRKFNNYLELLFLSEVETKVIFVIGEDAPYEYYWETLDMLNSIAHFKEKYSFDFGKKWNEFYFWNPKKLKYGLEGFC